MYYCKVNQCGAPGAKYRNTGVAFIENHVAVVPSDDVIDKAISEDILASLEKRALVDADDIDVSVSDGVVALSGSVPNWVAMQAAVNAGLFATGVKMLDNNLVITGV